jgi:hypothetical protein
MSKRDSQRQRVYSSERTTVLCLKEARIYNRQLTIEQMRSILDEMGCKDVCLKWAHGKATASYYRHWDNSIHIKHGMDNLWTIIHEGCHAIIEKTFPSPYKNAISYSGNTWYGPNGVALSDVAGHGWEFANLLLCKIHTYFGEIGYAALETAYRNYKVKYLPPREKRKYNKKVS